MNKPEIGAVVRIDGELYECVGIAEGTSVYFERVAGSECARCGLVDRRTYLVHAPNYEQQVKPVKTIGGAQ